MILPSVLKYLKKLSVFTKLLTIYESRSPTVFIHRFLLVAVYAAYIFLVIFSSKPKNIDLLQLILHLFIFNIAYSIILGVGLFLPVLHENKDENILDLLSLSEIGPFTFLVGKFISRFIIVIFIQATQIPIIYFFYFSGAVDFDTIIYLYAILLILAFHFSTLSILSSALSRNKVTGVMFVVVLFCIFTILFIELALYLICPNIDPWLLRSPLIFLDNIFIIFSPVVNPFLIYYYILHLFISGVIFFLLSTYLLKKQYAYKSQSRNLKILKSKFKKLLNIFYERYLADTESEIVNFFKKIKQKIKVRRFSKSFIIYKDFYYTVSGPLIYLLQIVIFVYIAMNTLEGISLNKNCITYYTYKIYEFSEYALPFCILIIITCVNLVFYSELKNKTLYSLILLPKSYAWLYFNKILSAFKLSLPSSLILVSLFILLLLLGNVPKKLELIYLTTTLIAAIFISSFFTLRVNSYSLLLSSTFTSIFFYLQVLIYIHFIALDLSFFIAGLFVNIAIAIIFSVLSITKMKTCTEASFDF